jgi:acyl-coenzyme A synthetase/AMP-(fatty) acid ligase
MMASRHTSGDEGAGFVAESTSTCLDFRPKLPQHAEPPPTTPAADLLATHFRRLAQVYASAFAARRGVGSCFTLSFCCPPHVESPRFGLWLRECARQGQLARLVAAYLETHCGVLVQVLALPVDGIQVSVGLETTCEDVERFVGALEPAVDALFHRRSDLLFRYFAGPTCPVAVHREAEGGALAVDDGAPGTTLRVLYEAPDLQTLARLDASLLAYDDRAASSVGRWLAGRLSPFLLERRTVDVGSRWLFVEHVCFPSAPEADDCSALEAAVASAHGVEPCRDARLVLSQAAARRLAARNQRSEETRTAAAAAAKYLLRTAVEHVLLPQLEGNDLELRFAGADAATERELRAHWLAAAPATGGPERPRIEVVLVFPNAPIDELVPRPNSVVLDIFGVLRWRPTPATLQSNVLYARGASLQVLGAPVACAGPFGQQGIDAELFAALLQHLAGRPPSPTTFEALADGAELRVSALRGFWGDILPVEWSAFQRHRRVHPASDCAASEVTILNPPLAPHEQTPLNVCEQVFCEAHLASSSTLVAPGTAEAVTYAELRARALTYAQRFRQLGLERGAVVALAAPDGIASVAIMLGCLMGGWVFAPLNFHSEANLRAMLEAAKPKLVLYDPACAPSLATFRDAPSVAYDSVVALHAPGPSPSDFAPVRVSPGSTAFILFTSGSTGTPKAVAHSHRDLLECSRNYAAYVLGLTSADRVHTPSPMFFAYGLHNLTLSLLAGATHVVAVPKASGVLLTDLLAKYEITALLAVPAVYKLLLSNVDRTLTFPRLRLCVSAGEKLPPRLFRELRDFFGVNPLDGIGCTEALSTFISNRPTYAAADCTGVVVPGFAVKLLNERGKLCEIGEVGTLWLRGGALTEAYMTDPELTRTTFRDGWFQTRDMFYYDAEYRFYNVGRASSTIKINACWFSAETVEAILQTHPAVRECIVGIVNDQYDLPRPKAFVVVDEAGGYAQDIEHLWRELRALSKERLGKDQYPHLFARIDAVPRTASGKLMRSHPSLTQPHRSVAVETERDAAGRPVMSWT